MSYGSTFKSPSLSKSLIGTVSKEKDNALTEFFRQLLTIGGLALSFTGLGVIEETIAQLAISSIQETLDVKEGTTNVLGSLINFGAPVIGAKFAASRNLKEIDEVSKSVNRLRNIGTKFTKANAAGKKNIIETLVKAGIVKEGATAADIKAINNLATQASFVIWKSSGVSSFARANYGVKRIINQTTKNFASAAIKANSTITAAFGSQDIRKIFEGVRGLSEEGIEESLKIAVEGQERLLAIGFNENEVNVITNIINDSSLSNSQKYSTALGFIRSISLEGKGIDFKRFQQLLTQAEKNINEALQLPIARAFQREVNSLYPEAKLNDLKKTFSKSTRSNKRRLRSLLLHPSSAEYNDRIVQPLQALFDPNDAGRAPIEFLYRKLKKQLQKQISRISKNLGKLDKIEDAFEAAGGIVLDSTVLLGYKIIQEAGIDTHLIEISFKPEPTNGKAPVYVFATPLQIEKLVAGTMRYYLRTWAYSRGGRSLSLGGSINSVLSGSGLTKPFTRQTEFLLSFLHTNALRNIFSIVSNVVENSANMADGKYFKQWAGSFSKSFGNASVNRTFRLFGRELVGGTAKALFGNKIGGFIGKEFQRLGTTVGAPIVKNVIRKLSLESKLESGTITTGERRQLAILNANGSTSGITKNTLLNAAAASLQSNVRGKLRRQLPNSISIHTYSARRKLQIVGRVPNTVTPKRPFKGFKI